MTKNCCLCFSVEVGAKIIGWLDLIFSIVAWCFFILFLSETDDRFFLYYASIISLVAFGGRSIMAPVLLVGFYKPKPELILNWMLYSLVMLLFSTVVFFIYMAMGVLYYYPLAVLLILVYVMNVVNSYHDQLIIETAPFERIQEV